MKKRAVALLMAALIGTVGMTGCGDSQTETTKDTVEETVKPVSYTHLGEGSRYEMQGIFPKCTSSF